MQRLKRSTRIYIALALPLCIALIVALTLVQRMRSHLQEYKSLLDGEVRQQLAAREMQTHFKKQVQEWKDVLLRGRNSRDLKFYWDNYLKEEQATQGLAQELMRSASASGMQAQVSAFGAAHQKLGVAYRRALNAFEAGNGNDTFAADRMVRGMDRAPTDLIDGIVAGLNARAEARSAAILGAAHFEFVVIVIASLLALGSGGVLALLLCRGIIDLRSSDERFRTLFEGSLQGIVIFQAGRVVSANQAAAEMLGFRDPAEIVAFDRVFELFAPHERQRLAEVAKARLAGLPVIEQPVIECVRRDGTQFWVFGQTWRIEWKGEPAIQIVFADATKQKRAEQNLRDSERRYRDLIEGSLQGIAIIQDHRFVFVNASFARMFGYENPEELLTLPSDLDVVAPNERESSKERMRALFAGEPVPDLVIMECVRKDGSAFWIHREARRIEWSDKPADQVTAIDVTEQRRAEEKLRSAHEQVADRERRFRELVEGSLQGIVVIQDGVIRFANRAMAAILGYADPAEIVGRRQTEFIAPGSLPVVAKVNEDFWGGKPTSDSLLVEVVRRDGKSRWLLSATLRIRWDGAPAGQSVVIDITEQKEASAAIETHQRLLRQVLDTLPHTVVVKDLHGKIILCNQAKADYHGLHADALVGKRSDDLPWADANSKEVSVQTEQRVLATGKAATVNELETVDVQGRRSIRKLIQLPLLAKDGQVEGTVGLSLDTTAEVMAYRAAEIARAQLAHAIESFPGSFSLWDDADRLVMFNTRHAEIWPSVAKNLVPGITFEEMARRSTQAALGVSEVELDQRIAEMVADFGQAGIAERKYGERWLQLIRSKLTGGGTISIALDITKARQQEEELRQSQKIEALGNLTGGVAHDFNNLLTIIRGNAEFLLEILRANPEAEQANQMVLDAARRASDLTKRLLAFARRQVLQPEELDLNSIVMGMETMLRRTLGEDIDIEVVGAGGLWKTRADLSQIESTLLNLAVNARDAMPEGGKLTIETGNARLDEAYAAMHGEVRPGQYVLLSVSDTGTGMTPEVVARAFDPFFTTKEPGRGTGMGLAMIYGFVKQSEGHVKIYSELGHGTSVKIYLPRFLSGVELARPEPPDSFKSVPSGHETILVVEDDELVRRYAVRQLRGLGYAVLEAKTGPTAYEILKGGEAVDLLFTDVIMPGGMNGKKLAEAAVQLRPGLKVLYTSGYSENVIMHQGRLDPGIKLLNKPYGRAELANKLRQVLDLPSRSGLIA